jgi:outer membrane protein assembly factor BamD (BamD/ComL family)
MDDSVLFQSGVASYESDKYHDWAIEHLDRLTKEYPNSNYFRGAKLWSALTKLKVGMKKDFFATVEEFRLKYRNTTEWKILSVHYEKIASKYRH